MMKFKVLFLLAIISLMSFSVNAQRGVRIGYIDTEYILQNVPEYQEASTQLDKKVLQWKSEIEKRLKAIDLKKKELDNESVLLTKELYDERFEDISFEQAEVLDYQQKRFGPSGDLLIQKRQLIEPIQDQIFAAVQEIAKTKKYDFVLDKSADVVMLYSAERFDMSEQVLRTITRTSKRSQAKNKKERKALEDEAVVPIVSGELDEGQKALLDKKAAREAQLKANRLKREKEAAARKLQQQEIRDAKKREAEERRQKAADARKKKPEESEAKAKSKDTIAQANKKEGPKTTVAKTTVVKTAVAKTATAKTEGENVKTSAELLEEKRLKKVKDREARVKALEAKKQKIIQDRKKARDERLKKIKKNDSVAKANKSKEGENN